MSCGALHVLPSSLKTAARLRVTWCGSRSKRSRTGPWKGEWSGTPKRCSRPYAAPTARTHLETRNGQSTCRTVSAHSGRWSRIRAHHGRRGNVTVTAVTSERRTKCKCVQGQGVTKAKGERQLEPRHVGPGTGKVMPQMPGYLAHHATLPPQTASRACQWSIRPTYARDGRCWYGIGERVGKWRQPPPAVAALRPARSRRPRL